MAQNVRQEVLELMSRKDKIESEIQELTSILTRNGVGMQDPLVDSDGFPLNTVDIYQVRHARNRIICLQNDHKAIMKQIELGLQGYYGANAVPQQNGNHSTEQDTRRNAEATSDQHKIPFAKVTSVIAGSPAATAGLETGDLIIEFGSINSSNFSNVTDIANVVRHSEGHYLRLKLKRGDRTVVTRLLPKVWSRPGLLGCTIVEWKENTA